MNEELKEALKLIKNECTKHESCKDCPLSDEDWHNYFCSIDTIPPSSWEVD